MRGFLRLPVHLGHLTLLLLTLTYDLVVLAEFDEDDDIEDDARGHHNDNLNLYHHKVESVGEISIGI